MSQSIVRLFIVVTIGLVLGAIVAAGTIAIQAGVDAANRHIEALDSIELP